jgi:hypothetical protein
MILTGLAGTWVGTHFAPDARKKVQADLQDLALRCWRSICPRRVLPEWRMVSNDLRKSRFIVGKLADQT